MSASRALTDAQFGHVMDELAAASRHITIDRDAHGTWVRWETYEHRGRDGGSFRIQGKHGPTLRTALVAVADALGIRF